MAEKTRYSDEELEEFRTIINEKLTLAKRDYNQMMRQLMNADGNDVDDTSPTYKVLEEGSATQSKEELIQLASRQQKFIQGLEAALVRIENKTYGIDRRTPCHIERGIEKRPQKIGNDRNPQEIVFGMDGSGHRYLGARH